MNIKTSQLAISVAMQVPGLGPKQISGSLAIHWTEEVELVLSPLFQVLLPTEINTFQFTNLLRFRDSNIITKP